MYILDTCVVSHLGPTQSRPNPSIRDWLRINGDKCFLSVVTLTEIAYGISWLRHRAATTRADRIQAWYEEIVAYHGDRIVPIDTEIAVRAGVRVVVPLRHRPQRMERPCVHALRQGLASTLHRAARAPGAAPAVRLEADPAPVRCHRRHPARRAHERLEPGGQAWHCVVSA